jgi:UrcA family protein
MNMTLKNSKRFTLAAVAAIGLASVTVGAHADEMANDMQVRTVHYSDLNLNTQEGVAILYKRIHGAAEQVCGDVYSRRLNEAAVAKACVDRAVSTSVQSVNNAKLTREYDTHFGVAKSITVASVR